MQAHTVGYSGSAGDVGVGLAAREAWLDIAGLGCCAGSGVGAGGVMGMVLLPVLGSLLVLMMVSLLLQWVHRAMLVRSCLPTVLAHSRSLRSYLSAIG